MTRLRLISASLVLAAGLTACEGFKEAMTAHVDTVARAGSQELTVTRLAELLGPTDVPLQPDAIRTVAQLWVNYQLLGQAVQFDDLARNLARVGFFKRITQVFAARDLTIDALDPQAMIPEYKICAVKIEPATAAELEQTLQMA